MTTYPSLEILAPPEIRLKFVDADKTAIIEGWAARFNELDAVNDRIAPGAFAKSLAVIASSGHRLPMLMSHRQEEPIGSWHDFLETAEGLYARGKINTAVARGGEALALVKSGDLSGLSIGYAVPDGARTRNRDGSFTLHEINLLEVSLVAIPAASRARVTLKDFGDLSGFADFLRTAGVGRREAEFIARKAWPAIAGDEPEPQNLNPLAKALETAARDLAAIRKG